MSTNSPAVTTAPKPTKPGLLASMAATYGVDSAKFLATIKATVMPSSKPVSDEELIAFCTVAHKYELNPFLKEIYAFTDKRGGISAVVGVDGWISLMNRHPDFDGIEFSYHDGEDGNPVSCTGKIYVKGRSRPVCVTEYFSECVRQTDPWRTCKRRMLRHKTLIQCARVAFGFSGLKDEDDVIDVETVAVAPPKPRLSGPAAIKSTYEPQMEPEPIYTDPIEQPPADDQIPGAEVPAAPASGAPTMSETQEALAAFVAECKATFDQFRTAVMRLNWFPLAEAWSEYIDIPDSTAKRLLGAKHGLKNELAKGGA